MRLETTQLMRACESFTKAEIAAKLAALHPRDNKDYFSKRVSCHVAQLKKFGKVEQISAEPSRFRWIK